MKFLHTADWQLGMTRHFLAPEAQARFSQARLDAITAIGRVAEEEGAEFVVVCGDVFETNYVDRPVVVRALENMGACRVPFFLLPGNHDPLSAGSVYTSPTFRQHCPPNVTVLAEPGVHVVRRTVELVAAPWANKAPLVDLVTTALDPLQPAPIGTTRIAVGHGALDVRSPAAGNPALIRLAGLEAALHDGRVHYVALGDRHSTTGESVDGRIWHAGAPEPTDYDEVDPGNVLVVELTDGRCSVTPKRVASWTFLRERFDLTGAADVEALRAWLESVPDKGRTVVKLAKVGTLSLRDHAVLEGVLEHFADLFGAIEDWPGQTELVLLPDDADFGALGLVGFARDAVGDLKATVEGGDAVQAAVAGEALALLYRLRGSAA